MRLRTGTGVGTCPGDLKELNSLRDELGLDLGVLTTVAPVSPIKLSHLDKLTFFAIGHPAEIAELIGRIELAVLAEGSKQNRDGLLAVRAGESYANRIPLQDKEHSVQLNLVLVVRPRLISTES